MKAKTRNYGVCALVAAVLLAMAMLVTGCPVEPSTDAGYKPSPGMGAIQLKFGPIARGLTTLPDTADENWFALFGLEFQPWTGGPGDPAASAIPEEYYTLTQLASPIELLPGDYTLIVIGYAEEDDGKGMGPAATASLNFSIAMGPTLTETITLKVYDPDAFDGGGDGMFAWIITDDELTDPLNSIIMNVTTIAGLGTVITDRNIITELTNTTGVALPAGYYYVVFELTTEGGIAREFRHVLHIYQNMTSTFTYTFNNAKLGIDSVENAKFTIKYDPVEDFAPIWIIKDGFGEGTEAEPLIISLSGETKPDSGIITVTNFTNYDGKNTSYTQVQWYCNGYVLSIGTDIDLTINNNVAPFNVAGTYQLKITGLAGEVPYEAEDVFIKVIEDLDP